MQAARGVKGSLAGMVKTHYGGVDGLWATLRGKRKWAALLWATYRNVTPAQARYERKRHYRHPGLSPLAVAGFPPGPISYLDALEV